MGDRTMRIQFSSGITKLTERNESFDSGILRVAYTGKNRNNSFISKESFERALPSIYNCPIVCNYDRETESIGSHDVELVHSSDGGVRMVNVTQPVGVIPESATYHWEEIEDDSGIHEYLCVDALIWKRQEAYRKIKEDVVTDESMEISVKDGGMVNGVYMIRDFEFTAFCLLGSAEPCFESASLELFSLEDTKAQFEEMMRDYKAQFSMISNAKDAVEDKYLENLKKGGAEGLELKMELLAKYGLTADAVELDVESMSYEELEAEMKKRFDEEAETEDPAEEADDDGSGKDEPTEGPASEPEVEEVPTGDDGDDDTAKRNSFGLLASQLTDELIEAIGAETVETAWGPMSRYCYIDHSVERSEVYAYDMEDWCFYGFAFHMDGDAVVIDFETKARKKFDIVDFDGGEQNAAFSAVFQTACEKYKAASEQIEGMKTELDELRQFKKTAEETALSVQRDSLFEQFNDLVGIEAFEALKSDCGSLSLEELEEKCYAIRGRNGTKANFSVAGKAPKLKIENNNHSDEPYGGVFAQYGFEAND